MERTEETKWVQALMLAINEDLFRDGAVSEGAYLQMKAAIGRRMEQGEKTQFKAGSEKMC